MHVVKTDFGENKEALQGCCEPELGACKAVANPSLPPWKLKKDRDEAIRNGLALAKSLFPKGYVPLKYAKEYSDKAWHMSAAVAQREYLLDSGASIDLLGEDGLTKEEKQRVKSSGKVLKIKNPYYSNIKNWI